MLCLQWRFTFAKSQSKIDKLFLNCLWEVLSRFTHVTTAIGPDLLKVCVCKNVYKLDITCKKCASCSTDAAHWGLHLSNVQDSTHCSFLYVFHNEYNLFHQNLITFHFALAALCLSKLSIQTRKTLFSVDHLHNTRKQNTKSFALCTQLSTHYLGSQ